MIVIYRHAFNTVVYNREIFLYLHRYIHAHHSLVASSAVFYQHRDNDISSTFTHIDCLQRRILQHRDILISLHLFTRDSDISSTLMHFVHTSAHSQLTELLKYHISGLHQNVHIASEPFSLSPSFSFPKVGTAVAEFALLGHSF